jgi:dCTP deaminase
MAFIGYNELASLIKEKNIIDKLDFNPKMLEGASYQLTLGNEVFVTNSKSEKKEILDDKNSQVDIKPGQFALLLINEKISIPYNILAFIALKFSVKAKGLVNISGFHVDPGFSGKLVYSVYNAGASTIVLEKGKPYFSIWFSELKGEVNKDSDSKTYNDRHEHQFQDNIPARYVEALKGDLTSPNVLLNRIKDAESLKKNQTYVLGIIAAALIGICINLFWSDSSYKKGYIDGTKNKEAKEMIDKIIFDKNIDSLLNKKADSMVFLKQKSMKNN